MIENKSYKISDLKDLVTEKRQSLSAKNPDFLGDLRQFSEDRYLALGLPTPDWEDWRFTPLSALSKTEFSGSSVLDSVNLPEYKSYSPIKIVLINGVFSQELSNLNDLPPGLKISSLNDAILTSPDLLKQHLGAHTKDAEHPFVFLNTALFNDGIFVHVEKHVRLANPVHIVELADSNDVPVAYNTRILIVVEENAELTVIETNKGREGSVYFNNSVLEASVAKAGLLYHYRIQDESKESFNMTTIDGTVDQGANFVTQTINLGGKFVRNDVGITLNGKDGFCTMNGLTFISGNQFVDNHTRLDHAQPNCETHELYKTILDDNAKAVFNGKIMVRQIAQKTNAKQTNKNLLLSANAQIHSNPQLEIFADDVKCTHGATIGQIDESQLYYLKSRGISEAEARRMLIFAFANDLVEKIHVAELRQDLEKVLLSVTEESHTVEAV